MKTRKLLIVSVLILLCSISLSQEDVLGDGQSNSKGQISIVCPNELQGLASEWAKAYQVKEPGANINLSVYNDPAKLETIGQVAFVQENEIAGLQGWKMAVGREVIVPVINSDNPYASFLDEYGVSQEKLRTLLTGSVSPTWGPVTGNGVRNPMLVYILNDPSVLEGVKQFLGLDDLGEHIKVVDSQEQINQSIKNDPYALAFCRLSGIIEPGKQKFADQVRIMPIDKNANGKLDYIENIYKDAEAFSRGLWIGKYPKSLIKDVYAFSPSQPSGDAQVAFLTWVLTEGQKSLASYGFSNLAYSEIQSKIDKIDVIAPEEAVASEGISFAKLLLFVIAALLVIGIFFSALFGFRKEEKEIATPGAEGGPTFGERSVSAPGGLYYDKSHTWAFMEKDGSVKIGIDDFLQHITGPITRIEMKKPGEKVAKGELFLSLIQRGKQLKLYAPVSGTILERNSLLEGNSSVLNTAPYTDGWVYRIEPAKWLQEIMLLNMAEKYSKWLSDEFSRLKDFLAGALQSHKIEYSRVVLQDGGDLKNNLLEDFGPEVWEDFQSKFIDTYK